MAGGRAHRLLLVMVALLGTPASAVVSACTAYLANAMSAISVAAAAAAAAQEEKEGCPRRSLDFQCATAFLRIQKVAGSSMHWLCGELNRRANLEVEGGGGGGRQLVSKQDACVLWGAHLDYGAMSTARGLLALPPSYGTFTMLREPVARLISEYHMCTRAGKGKGALTQDQWDYVNWPRIPPDWLRRLPAGNVSLAEYVTASLELPALNRMTRYLSGGRGRRPARPTSWLGSALASWAELGGASKPTVESLLNETLLPPATVDTLRALVLRRADNASKMSESRPTRRRIPLTAEEVAAEAEAEAAKAAAEAAAAAAAASWFAPTTDEDLTRARRHLEFDLTAFGITERWEDSLRLLGYQLRWPPLITEVPHPRRCDGSDGRPVDRMKQRAAMQAVWAAKEAASVVAHKQNVNSAAAVQAVNGPLRAQIAARSGHDVELYRSATVLFESRLSDLQRCQGALLKTNPGSQQGGPPCY